MTIDNYKWTTMAILEKINKHNEHLKKHDEHQQLPLVVRWPIRWTLIPTWWTPTTNIMKNTSNQQ
jgi:hypothetical protein